MTAPFPTDEPAAVTNAAEYTVSELSRSVRRTVEDGFGHVRVRGEIGGFRGRHTSGHAYFSLKDADASIDAVVWRSAWQRLGVKPEEGLEVIASGRLTTFAKKSSYQIVVEQLEPAGVGALMKLLEERRKKLAAEGLFDEARKRPLPSLPAVIGVVTSPTGAVIRDILHRVADRFPSHVVVWPVRVQGETSGAEVAAAVTGFAEYAGPRPDVIIVARGGGSVEDLWGYNDEALVRAVAASPIPVISAVGHETDWTLIDHVADHRAPTPTGAAEQAVPVRADCLATLADRSRRLDVAVSSALERRGSALKLLTRALPDIERVVGAPRQRLDVAAERLAGGLYKSTALARQRFTGVAARVSTRSLTHMISAAQTRRDTVTAALQRSVEGHLKERRSAAERAGGRLSPRLLTRRMGDERAALERLTLRRDRALDVRVAAVRSRFEATVKLLAAVSYQGVLARGFALVRSAAGTPVRASQEVTPGERLSLEFADGRVAAVAEGDKAGPKPARPAATKAAKSPRRAKKEADDRQGLLF